MLSHLNRVLVLLAAVALTQSAVLLKRKFGEQTVFKTEKNIRECPSIDHVCARVWKQGVYVQHLCTCPGKSRCPETWDAQDGQTVQIKDDVQDKYCASPEVNHICKHNDVAFSVVAAISPHPEFYRQGVNCQCPFSDGLYQESVYVLRAPDRNVMKYVHNFGCGKLPVCQRFDACAQYFTDIREERRTRDFVARVNLCLCPLSKRCAPFPNQLELENIIGPDELPFDLHFCID